MASLRRQETLSEPHKLERFPTGYERGVNQSAGISEDSGVPGPPVLSGTAIVLSRDKSVDSFSTMDLLGTGHNRLMRRSAAETAAPRVRLVGANERRASTSSSAGGAANGPTVTLAVRLSLRTCLR